MSVQVSKPGQLSEMAAKIEFLLHKNENTHMQETCTENVKAVKI